MAINKLSGDALTILDWCYVEVKERKKDPGLPLRGDNIATDEKNHMPVPKIRVVLDDLVTTVNAAIDEVEKIPQLEVDLATLEATLETQLKEYIDQILYDHENIPDAHHEPTPAGGAAGTTTGP